MSLDTGLLIVRVVVGALIAGHGAQKLFGWFGGYGIDGTAGWLGSVGIRQPKLAAYVVGLGEVLGGLAFLFGLFTPLAAALIAGIMLVAASTHISKGVWAQNGGLELPLTNLALAVTLGLSGAGLNSLDALLGLNYTTVTYFVAQLIVLAGVIPPLLQMHYRPNQASVKQAQV